MCGSTSMKEGPEEETADPMKPSDLGGVRTYNGVTASGRAVLPMNEGIDGDACVVPPKDDGVGGEPVVPAGPNMWTNGEGTDGEHVVPLIHSDTLAARYGGAPDCGAC